MRSFSRLKSISLAVLFWWLAFLPCLAAAEVVGSSSGSDATKQVYFVHTDNLDAPRVIVDSGGTVAWRWESDGAGGAGVTGNVEIMSLRYPGQYRDSETGLHYNYFRDYDPQTGRYVESDPIGLHGGINTYTYAASNPLKYVDPTGQCIEDLCIGETIVAVSWCASNPACASGVVALVGGGIYASATKPPRVNDPQAAEHQAYKDAYRQPPPPNLDECEQLKWRLKREQDLLAARTAWDAKWVIISRKRSHNRSVL
jgi:RHS repeat-associated protein